VGLDLFVPWMSFNEDKMLKNLKKMRKKKLPKKMLFSKNRTNYLLQNNENVQAGGLGQVTEL